MTFDLFFRFILILFVAVHAGVAVRALRRGRWIEAGRAYPRAAAPLAFWREIGLASFRILLAAAALLAVPRPVAGGRDPPYAAIFVFIVLAPGLIRALWAGEIEFGSNRWSRRGDPGPYWAMAFIGLALVALCAFAMIRGLAGS